VVLTGVENSRLRKRGEFLLSLRPVHQEQSANCFFRNIDSQEIDLTNHGSSSKTFAGGITLISGITSQISCLNLASASGFVIKKNKAAAMVLDVGPDPARKSSDPSCESRITDFSSGGNWELCCMIWNTVVGFSLFSCMSFAALFWEEEKILACVWISYSQCVSKSRNGRR
jgi:hypothetical protein